MSDEDLVTILEQLHQGRFQLRAAAPSLTNQQQPKDTPIARSPPIESTENIFEDSHDVAASQQEGITSPSNSPSSIQDGQNSDRQQTSASMRPAEKQAAREQDSSAANSLPDSWQQQTYRLQAFARPLMQRLQGTSCTNLIACRHFAPKTALRPSLHGYQASMQAVLKPPQANLCMFMLKPLANVITAGHCATLLVG